MTPHPASSTPRPLSRKRESADKRPRLVLAGAVPAQPSDDNVNSSGLTPAIQKKEGQSDTRLANLSRITALRVEIRSLIEVIALAADVDLLDLMRDETGSYSRHKAAQEARTWASAAGLTLETGLMQLDRAMRSDAK